jgi:hypothetical protein
MCCAHNFVFVHRAEIPHQFTFSPKLDMSQVSWQITFSMPFSLILHRTPCMGATSNDERDPLLGCSRSMLLHILFSSSIPEHKGQSKNCFHTFSFFSDNFFTKRKQEQKQLHKPTFREERGRRKRYARKRACFARSFRL